MGDFFHGWRRKVGTAAMLIALLLVGFWFRSFASTNDHVKLWANHSLYSHNGSVSWNINYADFSRVNDLKPVDPTRRWKHEVKWRREYFGFVASDTLLPGGRCVQQYWISYWNLISPLTLIAAYLILVKPRRLIPKTKDEPTRTERR